MGRGFSLVELSIVLVILGLLTGGILAGRSLIRASELRSVTADAMRYRTAIYAFRDKYFYLPGDMLNATSFWGAADAVAVTCYTTVGTGTQTCNGNGNGDMGSSSVTTSAAAVSESFRAWQQLANAGLIEGNYTGVVGTAPNYFSLGGNVPASRLSNVGYRMGFSNGSTSSTEVFFTPRGNMLEVGAVVSGNTGLNGPAFEPEEMWNIDTKLDDGRVSYGRITARRASSLVNPGCATTDDPTTAEYSLSSGAKLCSVMYLLQ